MSCEWVSQTPLITSVFIVTLNLTLEDIRLVHSTNVHNIISVRHSHTTKWVKDFISYWVIIEWVYINLNSYTIRCLVLYKLESSR